MYMNKGSSNSFHVRIVNLRERGGTSSTVAAPWCRALGEGPAARRASLRRGRGTRQGHGAAASRGGARRQGRGGCGSPRRPSTAANHRTPTRHPHIHGFKVILHDFLSCTHMMTIMNFASNQEALNKQSRAESTPPH